MAVELLADVITRNVLAGRFRSDVPTKIAAAAMNRAEVLR